MYADSVVQPHIDARARLIDVPPPDGDESNCEFAQLRLAHANVALALKSASTVDPDCAGSIDEDVGDVGIRDEWSKHGKLGEVSAAPGAALGTGIGIRLSGPARNERNDHAATVAGTGSCWRLAGLLGDTGLL